MEENEKNSNLIGKSGSVYWNTSVLEQEESLQNHVDVRCEVNDHRTILKIGEKEYYCVKLVIGQSQVENVQKSQESQKNLDSSLSAKLLFLRKEMASLISQDDALFRQLVNLQSSIAELRKSLAANSNSEHTSLSRSSSLTSFTSFSDDSDQNSRDFQEDRILTRTKISYPPRTPRNRLKSFEDSLAWSSTSSTEEILDSQDRKNSGEDQLLTRTDICRPTKLQENCEVSYRKSLIRSSTEESSEILDSQFAKDSERDHILTRTILRRPSKTIRDREKSFKDPSARSLSTSTEETFNSPSRKDSGEDHLLTRTKIHYSLKSQKDRETFRGFLSRNSSSSAKGNVNPVDFQIGKGTNKDRILTRTSICSPPKPHRIRIKSFEDSLAWSSSSSTEEDPRIFEDSRPKALIPRAKLKTSFSAAHKRQRSYDSGILGSDPSDGEVFV